MGDQQQVSAQSLRRSLERTYRAEEQSVRVLMDTPHCILGAAIPEYYPLRIFENDTLFVCLEGRIYGLSDNAVDRQLMQLGQRVTSHRDEFKNELRQWLLNTDGQFICVIAHKGSGRTVLFNDVFGRLPLYYHLSERRGVFSRDLSLVSETTGRSEFDRQSIWQYLLLLYCLEYRTLLKDVFRLPAASLVMIDTAAGAIQKEAVYTFDFQQKQNELTSLEANAEQLADLLTEACRTRTDADRTTVLSLSGGLDSRALAGALKRAGRPFETASWLDAGRRAKTDVEVAGEVAEALGVERWLCEPAPATGADVLELLRIKTGQVFLGIPHALQYFRNLNGRYGGRLIYFSGNGGDKVMPDLRPARKLRSLNQLVAHLLKSNQVFPLKMVSQLTGTDEEEILSELKTLLSSFPERSLQQKYVHFIICQRGFMRFLEGDERQRFFFEIAAPFWSPGFFFYAMNCPDEQKHGNRLYARMLQNLNCSLAGIDRAIEGRRVDIIVPDPAATPLADRLRRLPNPIRFARRTLRGHGSITQTVKPAGHVHSASVLDCLRNQSRRCAVIGEYFLLDKVNALLDDPSSCKRDAVSAILTVFSTMEWLTDKRSTLEDYHDTVMDPFM